MLQFTRNKQTGNYDVIGPSEEIREGVVLVTKKDGSTTEVTIGRLSKPFVAKFGPHEGKQCRIGVVVRSCSVCGVVERRNSRGYVENKIYRSGECSDCYEERKMGY